MAEKYMRDLEGSPMGITTKNLNLVKPLANEHYNIEVFNGNMDKIAAGVLQAQQTASEKAPLSHTHKVKDITDLTLNWDGITEKPNFHSVATSGNYNDLNNKPVPSSSIDSVSTTTFANSNAVKLVNDKIEDNTASIQAANANIIHIQNELTGQRIKAITLHNRLDKIF